MGGLPGARDHTAAAAAASRANMWNKLQDMIVGSKEPTIDYPIAAGAFVVKAGGGVATLGDGQWTFGGAVSLEARLHFPVGMRMRSVKFGFNRGGAGVNYIFELRERNLVTGAAVVQVNFNIIVAGTGWTTTTITQDYRFKADTAVWLQVSPDNAANIFGGAIITADR